jgi:MFS family permease
VRNRWGILAVLFTVRGTIAFQFQSIAAIAPLLTSQLGASLADVGVLIGLYFAPGVVLALPGGAIGQRFGDKRTALGALLLMLGGSVMMAATDSWNIQIAGRLVTGAGAVMLSVQVTKMLTDWFAGKEIATAMAILVNSWPLGIAVCLLALPWLGTNYGVSAAQLGVSAFMACAFVLLAILYRPPIDVAVTSTATAGRLDRNATLAVIAAGLIWACSMSALP